MRFFLVGLCNFLIFAPTSNSADLRINSMSFKNAPSWLSERRLEKVVSRIESVLEWDIRRIQVERISSQAEFEKIHGWGPAVLALAYPGSHRIQVGPKVTDESFDSVFGHELAHVIMFQKYKRAIPKWLEEGVANYAGRKGTVDYSWLSKQGDQDVTALTHPFLDPKTGMRFHYMASTALVEMIASKCRLMDLLQLSVSKKLEIYLPTFCGIRDVNADFRAWVKRKVTHPYN